MIRSAGGGPLVPSSPAVLTRGAAFQGLPAPVNVMLARRRWHRIRAARAWLAQAPGMDLVAQARYAAPGMVHASDLYLAEDVFGRPWGFLHVAATGHGSVVLDCDVAGIDLSDGATAEQWVAELGLWLALLTHEPDLAACTVTLDRPTSTHPATSTRRAITAGGPAGGRRGPAAPPRVRIQLTYRTLGAGGRGDVHAVATEVGARIPHLVRSLSTAGITTASATGPKAIAETVNQAYWAATPPRELTASAAQEDWGSLRHGRAPSPIRGPAGLPGAWTRASITWSLLHLTSAVVLSEALPQLLSAAPDRVHTRVSLVYQRHLTTSPGALEESWQTWSGLPESMEGSGAVPLDVSRSEPPRFAMLVTATADAADLRATTRGLTDSLDARLRPWLRPMYGAQAAGFAASLPLGLVLRRHAGRAHPLTAVARPSARTSSRGTTPGRSA